MARFWIDTFLTEGNLVAAVGGVDADGQASRLIWLVRVSEGRMAEMWTYHGS
ncbi:hypothetical protein [Nocardia sp. NPDC005366]|uniref:hypothetical protein n=1 Tax=Nocardia sp. NPDC005366 TaxID=3156878 RepID=UPI0033BE498F